MDDKGVLIVTRGGRGIGAAIARLGGARGYNVLVNYVRDASAAEAVASDIRSAGGRAETVQGSVDGSEGVQRIFAAADRMGTLAGLVNNAGGGASTGRVDTATAEAIKAVIALNLTGEVLCAIEAVRRMSTRHGGQGGAIVNISSVSSRHGNAGTNVAYAAAKGGVETFSVGLAQEVLGEGIRVNCIRPGMIDTEALSFDEETKHKIVRRIPIGRIGQPADIAGPAIWLLGDEASQITGTVFSVSGGGWIAPSP